MSVTGRGVTLAVVLLLGAAHAALAQRPHRSGLWFELGGGPSGVRVACTGCTDVTRRSGSGGYLRIGGAISDGVLMGIESFSLIDEAFGFGENDSTLMAENASLVAIVLWYPWRGGAFLKGGVGLAAGEFTVEQASEEPLIASGEGVGLTFGIGYDQPITRALAISANAGIWVTAIGDILLPEERVDDVIATLYSLSVGLTIR
jgi:hypothetical protein